jgi:hypothetical protein
MKKILLMTAFALCLSGLTNTASAALTCELNNCGTSIAGDSGTTQKKCYTTGFGCACTLAATGCSAVAKRAITSPCPGGYIEYDTIIGDVSKCCVINTCKKVAQSEVTQSEESISSDSKNLGDAFEANMDGRTNTYYGYVDATNRSPTNGRTSDPMAKLDACLFHTDVTAIDNYVGNSDDKHHQCVGASMGCGTTLKNEYCQASGTNDGATVSAAVCKDRCDCIYPGAEGSVCGGN